MSQEQKPSFWDEAKQLAIDTKIRRAKHLSKGQINSSWDKSHPDWVRDAQNNNYTVMINQITKQIKDEQALAMQRRGQLG